MQRAGTLPAFSAVPNTQPVVIGRVGSHSKPDGTAQNPSAIDVAFAQMAQDSEFQNEAFRIAEEFADSDCEAFELGDDNLPPPS